MERPRVLGRRLRLGMIAGGHCYTQPHALSDGKTSLPITFRGSGAADASASISRIPGGHPEGYLEAFATLYNEFADVLAACILGMPQPAEKTNLLPSAVDGLDGLRFIETAVSGSQSGGVWRKL